MNRKLSEALRRAKARRDALEQSLSSARMSGGSDDAGRGTSANRVHPAVSPGWSPLLAVAAVAGLAAAALMPLTRFETGRVRPAARAMARGAVTMATDFVVARGLSFAATQLGAVSARVGR
jgi:hypothetical protein